jgi:hypothetical protein
MSLNTGNYLVINESKLKTQDLNNNDNNNKSVSDRKETLNEENVSKHKLVSNELILKYSSE